MKKSILFAMFLGGVFAANAQTATNTTAGPATGNVTLNVKLYPLQSITVNSTVVDLNYVTADHYKNGVSHDVANHLTVFSTGAYKVTVKSNNDELSTTPANNTPIALADIEIQATSATAADDSAFTFVPASSAVVLSKLEDVVLGTGTAGTGTVNVSYSAAGNNAYLEHVVGNELTTYTANVLYSIVAN